MPATKEEVKTKAQWDASRQYLNYFLKIGDAVDEEMVDYFIGVLPPAYMSSSLVQIGEPYSHVGGRETYSTLAVDSEGVWRYRGHCWRGQAVEPQARA